MKTQVFLIDYENVQPDVLPALAVEDVRVLVFVGPQQGRLQFELVEAMQKLGAKAEYVRVARPGKDALDMHLAFHLGRLCCEMTDAYFHVIAKDRDYDPLLARINHPVERAAKWPDQALAALRWLTERPKNRPATRKTLVNTLTKAVFADRLDEEAIAAVVALLEKRKVVKLDGQKVTYDERKLEALRD